MNNETNEFAELELRARRVQEQLVVAPTVDILGVGVSGAGGAQSMGETNWTLLFSLNAWRVVGGPIQEKEMTVRRNVTHEELTEFRKKNHALHGLSYSRQARGGCTKQQGAGAASRFHGI